MLPLVVLTLMMSLAGYYGTRHPEHSVDNVAQVAQSGALAAGMASYRDALIAYFASHPGQTGSVTQQALIAAKVLPSWSPLAGAAAPLWNNYRTPDGILYIYAGAALPHNITAELLALSNNSVLVGGFGSGTSSFAPALGGMTTIARPPVTIPQGSPVWLAILN
ncbi:type IV pilus biogenesis protein PilM [Janthinobacterium agaricidamnosum]|uniref:Pilus assembly protein PilM n=1 Tax=Janthinobacterium agaricidamnosum NBRC 102515 = DSM 9628 TaxID=1349767 RepID=W0V4R4_9BURK|nr:type IV pilus biogenesis protein PilM [Janthinobacterium agaricidamnosum]CDG82343.1 putative uncharacterized protein [Janthinobacterium agaricidamnosum NBRC 102515 = DSM 9628]